MGKVHNFDESNKTSKIGNLLLEGLQNSFLIKGKVESTKGGGYEDKTKKIDGYIYSTDENGKGFKHSMQIKIDLKHPISGSIALELAEMNYDHRNLLSNARNGNLLQEQLFDVDFIIYICPGHGIYFWKPKKLNFLTHKLLTNYTRLNSWLEVKNTFRLVIADNKDWLSINYLVPYHMINEPNNYRFKLIDWENDTWEGAPVAVGPEKVIPWYDVLGTVQKNYPDKYQEIVTLIVEYANGFGITNRDKILRSWELNPEQT